MFITWMKAFRMAEVLLTLLDQGRHKNDARQQLLWDTLREAERDGTFQKLNKQLAWAKEEY